MKNALIIIGCAASVVLAGCGNLPAMYADDGSSVHNFGRNTFIYSRPGEADVLCNASRCEDGTGPPTSIAGLPFSNVARMEFDGRTFHSQISTAAQR